MKNFKNLLAASFLTIGAFASTMMVSCNPDPCKDVVCSNGGTCDDVTGACTCPAGYIGASCETKTNASFVGTWSAKEKVNGASTWGTPYTVICTADASEPKKFYFQNYGNYNCTSGNYMVEGITSNDGNSYTISTTACSTAFTGLGSIAVNGSTSQIVGTYSATYGSPTTTTDNVEIQMDK